jgi:LAO/AO transport system kinase
VTKKAECMGLVKELLKGNTIAVARLITLVENQNPLAREAMKEIYKYVGSAHIIGITGVPGSGKSTLISKLTKAYRKQNKTVGVIAIDPTSTFTGGALLGDRIRMKDSIGDEGVFIRSMGTRGASGGLSLATSDVIHILDAFNKDIIIVETIGIGQDKIEIENYVHTLVIVTMPGGGDTIQCIKAGILEVGDIYVVNKSDHPEASRAKADLEFMLELDTLKKEKNGWRAPILMTTAVEDKGIDELLQKLGEHHEYQEKSGQINEKRLRRLKAELLEIINQQVKNAYNEAIAEGGKEHHILEKMASSGWMDPYSAADMLMKHLLNNINR